MTDRDGSTAEGAPASAPVFISYASADRKKALAACEALERRGLPAWIALRDVAPGENYQEAIVRALREAAAVVLIFSGAANASDEIKKELSLASRYRLPVITLRLENAEPSDAFAYELATRQWVDAFAGWDRAIDLTVDRIRQGLPKAGTPTTAQPLPRRDARRWRGKRAGLAAVVALVVAVAAGWFLLRPPAPQHAMTVRLAEFQILSSDLPSAMRDAVTSEISAAFNADGVIGVSTAAQPRGGDGPAYALAGTISRIGNALRVITQLRNEQTGTVLWSDSNDYTADQVARVPHKIAVNAGIVVRCGLSGASTYRKPLPDAVLKDYLQYCQQSWSYGGSKTLLPALRVVAALPDFSWGWSAVQTGYMQTFFDETDPRRAEELRLAGLHAAERALALDPKNSEAIDRKTYLIDPTAFYAQEALYRAAIAAKPLDCGCEHYGYGLLLIKVGRVGDAVDQLRAATDMLALWPDSQISLADALLSAGQLDDAKAHLATAADLSTAPDAEQRLAVSRGVETRDYAGALRALADPRVQWPEASRAALTAGYRALAENNAAGRAAAIALLLALPKDQQSDEAIVLLAALGGSRQALQLAAQRSWLLWRAGMRPVLDEPGFPAVAERLGLFRYWRQSRTVPDACKAASAPSFCRLIRT